MKTKLAVIFLFSTALCLWAQTNSVPTPPTTPGVSGQGLILALIPLLVPVLVAIIKYFLPLAPSWSLPILASALGELANYISGLAGGPTTTALNGVLLGAAGVGVREVLDQVKTRVTQGKQPTVTNA